MVQNPHLLLSQHQTTMHWKHGLMLRSAWGSKGRQHYDWGARDGGKYDTRPTTSLPTIWLSRWRGHQLVPGRETDAGGIGGMGAFTKSYRAQPQAPYHCLGRREWSSRWRLCMSFGNGCHQHATLGYGMPTPGRIKSMTLCIVPRIVSARVGLVVNGRDVPEYVVSKSASQRAGIVSWSEGYELAPGDTVTFKTIWTDDEERASGAIVSTLIELDIWWNMHHEAANCTRNGRKPLSSSPLCRPRWQWQYPRGSVLSAPGDLTIEKNILKMREIKLPAV